VDSSATSVTNPVMSASGSVGDANVATAYSATTVTASIAPLHLRLDPGNRYGVAVCLNAHVFDSAPQGRCEMTEIDARSALSTASYEAPGVSRTLDRPRAGSAGYVTEEVDVVRQDGSTSTAFARSWPQANLAGASLPLFAVGASSGPLPEQQGIELPTGGHGGVNGGQPDSMCASGLPPPATPRDDLSTTALGDMPFYYEVGAPSGQYEGQAPTGVMILFHGGAWAASAGAVAQTLRGDADRWRARGWLTVNSSYRPCGAATADAISIYDAVRATYGAALPVCTFGQSAGGQLALLVAASRPGGVYCAVDQAGPTDAATLPVQSAYDAVTGGTQTTGPTRLYNLMVAAFGQENLQSQSPSQFAGSGLADTRILAASAARDTALPYAQMTLLRDRMLAADSNAYVDTLQLAAGDQPFVHASISREALDAYEQAERDLVAQPAGTATPAPGPPAASTDETAPVASAPIEPLPPWWVTLTAPRRHRVTDRVALHVTCAGARCIAVAQAAEFVPRMGRRRAHVYRTRSARIAIAPNRPGALVIHLSRAGRQAARAALKARRTVRVRVRVVVTAAAGRDVSALTRWIALSR
jgi:hypothetical protein